ncbi:hypothetical protein D1013_15420 [Euzebyella marina]|uniref:Class I SAM-dependent methyltransferase n=1 Tax=Euzebyella marina TaxID=1761453 RepID=A0A3G2L8Q9_9FLAO|nr:hypothetical protein [Euzebyella marina]AYN68668.1 hypothetical protein D1013_15420 [Euzebyella marina]
MFKFLKYIRFIARSTNQHGVHSPFVFAYVTQCLYSKKSYGSNKTLNVLLKNLDYFKVNRLNIYRANSLTSSSVKKHFPNISIGDLNPELIYVDTLTQRSFDELFSEKLGSLNHHSIILINDIYSNMEAIELWNRLKELSEVTVTVDMFYCGTVFFRKEQVEEHFKIRI